MDVDVALLSRVLAEYGVTAAEWALVPGIWGEHWRLHLVADDGRNFLLKEQPHHIGLNSWHFHQQLQPAVRPLPFVPALHRARNGRAWVRCDGRNFELGDWLPGRSRGLARREDFAHVAQQLALFHNWLSTSEPVLRVKRRLASTNYVRRNTGRLLHSAGTDPAALHFVRTAHRALAALPPDPLVPVHGDVHPYNLLWCGDQLSGICDWEDAHLDSPYFDLAYFLTHSTFIDWPERTDHGRDAEVRLPVEPDLSAAVIVDYRRLLQAPLPAGHGLRRALVACWLVTVSMTVFRAELDTPTMLQAQQVLDWLVGAPEVADWQDRLQR